MNKKKRSFKNYLMLPSFQLRLVAFVCLVIVFGAFAHGFVIWYLASKNVQNAFVNSADRLRAVWEFIKPAVIVSNGISVLIVCALLFIVSLLISHKLVGPVFKISGYIRKLSEGLLNEPELHLRSGDEGKTLCDAVNEMRNIYREKFRKLKKLESKISDESIKKELDDIIKDVEV